MAKGREFDVLICHDPDRFARNLAKQLVLEDELKRHGIAVRFFTVHEEADVWHRQVEREALGRVAATPEDRKSALAAADRCLDAVNRILDGVMRENGLAA